MERKLGRKKLWREKFEREKLVQIHKSRRRFLEKPEFLSTNNRNEDNHTAKDENVFFERTR